MTAYSPDPALTYSALAERLRASGQTRLAGRVEWLCRVADWHPDLEIVRASGRPATFGLTSGSFSTYKSEALKAVEAGVTRQRPRGIRDIGGMHRALYDHMVACGIREWVRGQVAPFLVFLHDNGVALSEITPAVYEDYLSYRIATKRHDEIRARKHVREVAGHVKALARRPEFDRFALVGPDHPFANGIAFFIPERCDELDGSLFALLKEMLPRGLIVLTAKQEATLLLAQVSVSTFLQLAAALSDGEAAAVEARRRAGVVTITACAIWKKAWNPASSRSCPSSPL
ncbi:MAG: hypothetical protein ACOCYW_00130 [Roseicyclus sp.]